MGSVDDKKTATIKRPPMRSSIACLRCRKSKIKCDNDGGQSSCHTCIKQGKNCKYPEATPVPMKRSEPPIKTEREGGSDRKRLKKLEDVSRVESHYSAAEEVLAANYLTESLWLQVFDIFRLHFATELPFLHMPSLKEKMGSKFRANSKNVSSDTNLVLLGVLTLTARFHQDLVKYATHAATSQPGITKSRPVSSKPDSSAASEYYADALRGALGPLGTSMSTASVERVQAFLMLGLYEWSQTRPKTGGLSAWMYVGVAIRMAQALGLGFGDKTEKSRDSRHRITKGPASSIALHNPELLIIKEIKRRTMFSCLILDRLLACGKERSSIIRADELQIQLPCSDMAFDLSEDIRTGFLKESSEEQRQRDIKNDSVLSRFLRLVVLWGEISRYSFAGGRLEEEFPPWDKRTKFYQLREELEDFYRALPPTFLLSTSNYYKHENYQASSVYVSLHMLGSVCQIMLHREYIPFLPIRCNRPTGPLDEPTFPEGKYDIPVGFWDQSAEQVFKSAKNIVDLIEICRDKLPMSALVVFAVWMAAFVGQYAWHFPHMDQARHMLDRDDDESMGSEAEMDISCHGPTGVTFKTLERISAWLKLAAIYVDTFKEVDKYLTGVTGKFQRLKSGKRDDGKTGISAGGLEEWRVQNAKIINNGMLLGEDERRSAYDASYVSRSSTIESAAPEGHNSASADRAKIAPRSTPMFTAINSANMAALGQQEPPLAPGPRHDGLSGTLNITAPSTPWNRYSSPSQHSPAQQVTTQSLYASLPQGTDVTHFMPEDNFMIYLDEVESMRIAEGLIAEGLGSGDLQFSYGDVPEFNMFYMQNAPMVQHGSYE